MTLPPQLCIEDLDVLQQSCSEPGVPRGAFMYSILYPVGTGGGDGSGGGLCHVQPPLGMLTEEWVSLEDGLGSAVVPPFQAMHTVRAKCAECKLGQVQALLGSA